MTENRAICTIASEIILWQSKNIVPGSYKSTYDFALAKKLAEHILLQGCVQNVFVPAPPVNMEDGFSDFYIWDKDDED